MRDCSLQINSAKCIAVGVNWKLT